MGRTYEGKLTGEGLRFGVVVSRWNEFITSKLLDGTMDALTRHGVAEEDVDIAWVPGSFEIPLTAKRMAGTGRYDAIICLGAVIRGATPHFDYIAGQAAKGIAQAGMDTDVPVLLGVIATDTIEQAIERAGTKAGNKGFEAAVAAIEMVNVLRVLDAAHTLS